MNILPIKTPILRKGDNLAEVLMQHGNIQSGDILVISSKAVATVEGSAIDLSLITPTKEAEQWAARCGGPSTFRQAILNEAGRMHGIILPGCPQAMLTELKPDGFLEGTILAINAGLDRSNVEEGYAIGWPRDPIQSVRTLKKELEKWCHPEPNVIPSVVEGRGATLRDASTTLSMTRGSQVAVILSDSCCRPRRTGVVAMALTVAGIDPIINRMGSADLFGHPLTMTQEATADQLATAANTVMGNADESIPAAIIRDHGIPFTSCCGWVPGINQEQDLFSGLF